MSTPNTPVFVRYTGGNDAVDFSIPFPYFDKSYVKLILKAGDNPEEYLEENTDYIWKDDQTITLNEALSENDVLVIVRRTDLGSPAEFDNQRRLFPVAVMDNDDLSFHQIQELQEQVDRCYKVRITSDESAADIGDEIQSALDEIAEYKDEVLAQTALAKQYAIGEPTEPLEHSAKYWATNAKFGAYKYSFRTTDWQQVGEEYKLTISDVSLVLATYQIMQSSETPAVVTIDVYDSGVVLTSDYAFNGYSWIVNAVNNQVVYTQSVAASTWTVTHNLGKYPQVTIIDDNGVAMVGTVTYTSLNAISVTFTSAVTGKLILD